MIEMKRSEVRVMATYTFRYVEGQQHTAGDFLRELNKIPNDAKLTRLINTSSGLELVFKTEETQP